MTWRETRRLAAIKRKRHGVSLKTKPKLKVRPRRLRNKTMADFDPIYEATIGRETQLRRLIHTNSPVKPITLPYISIQHIDIPKT